MNVPPESRRLHTFKEGEYDKKDLAKLELEAEKLHFEREKFAHSRWWQEDSLVNNRLTWLLQSQVILFAAFGLLAKDQSNSGSVIASISAATSASGASGGSAAIAKPLSVALVLALPYLGVLVCFIIAIGVRAAWLAQEHLQKDARLLGIQLGVSTVTTRGGRAPGYLLPLAFSAAWGWLLAGVAGVLLVPILLFLLILVIERALTWHST